MIMELQLKQGALLSFLQGVDILLAQHACSPPGPSLQSTAPQYSPQLASQQTNGLVGCGIPPQSWHGPKCNLSNIVTREEIKRKKSMK